MARRKRKPQHTAGIPRTIERIAIAAIAAIATRGSGESIAFVAITIFIILVVIEEFDRRWIWHGKTITLRGVALGSIGELRLRRAGAVERRKRERRRASTGRGAGHAVVGKADQGRGKLQE